MRAALALSLGHAFDGEIIGLRAGTGEHQIVLRRTDQRGALGSGGVEGFAGLEPVPVEGGGVAVGVLQPRPHCRAHLGSQGPAGQMIQIHAAFHAGSLVGARDIIQPQNSCEKSAGRKHGRGGTRPPPRMRWSNGSGEVHLTPIFSGATNMRITRRCGR